ncbi:MAG: hypothetical protein ACRCVV_06730 [Shewanella sp.]
MTNSEGTEQQQSNLRTLRKALILNEDATKMAALPEGSYLR